ncbi:MAG TPA: tRNA pseudouridine(55) synthase TruB [Desulfomicrobiaceae bacterium]|nr:tRNA pseudouridine(55) synthase TruB [Desulfomicrobiaceae bacterium]
MTQQHGVLVLDKPGGPTSTACLNSIKRTCRQKKIGHGGTLDPMATGVLLVLLGQGTKLAPYLTGERKTYVGTLTLGTTTDTYDIEGEVLESRPWHHLTEKEVEKEILLWHGPQDQVVPPVSAAKHKGKPLYALHRAGKEVPVKTKPREIFQVEILSMDLPLVTFRVTCSAGTYIRSLAHSLGNRLECGAVLTALRRESCHPFTLDGAHSLEEVLDDPDRFQDLVIPVGDALPHWPRIVLDDEQTRAVKNGARLAASTLSAPKSVAPGDRALFVSSQDEVLALVEAGEYDDVLCWAILRGLWIS